MASEKGPPLSPALAAKGKEKRGEKAANSLTGFELHCTAFGNEEVAEKGKRKKSVAKCAKGGGLNTQYKTNKAAAQSSSSFSSSNWQQREARPRQGQPQRRMQPQPATPVRVRTAEPLPTRIR